MSAEGAHQSLLSLERSIELRFFSVRQYNRLPPRAKGAGLPEPVANVIGVS